MDTVCVSLAWRHCTAVDHSVVVGCLLEGRHHRAEAVVGVAEFGRNAAARGTTGELDVVAPCAASGRSADALRGALRVHGVCDAPPSTLAMLPYFKLKLLMESIGDPRHVHFANVAGLRENT